jgi:hypothetical protein
VTNNQRLIIADYRRHLHLMTNGRSDIEASEGGLRREDSQLTEYTTDRLYRCYSPLPAFPVERNFSIYSPEESVSYCVRVPFQFGVWVFFPYQ